MSTEIKDGIIIQAKFIRETKDSVEVPRWLMKRTFPNEQH